MSNSINHPQAWKFYIELARNIENEPDINHLGKYRIPNPRNNGEFIYADDAGVLWGKFIIQWYKISLDSPSVYGKIQYIVNNFNH